MLDCDSLYSPCANHMRFIYSLFKYEQDLDETNDSISDEKRVPLGGKAWNKVKQ